MGRGKRKPKITNVEVFDIGSKGAAIGKTEDGEVVLISGAVPGDQIEANLIRKKKGMWNGFVKSFRELSPDRVNPECSHFEECGGCKWQNLNYKKQISLKEKMVYDAMDRIAKIQIGEKGSILGCENIYYYRNKLEYTFSNNRWVTAAELNSDEIIEEKRALGFHKPGKFDRILDIDHCHLQSTSSNDIRNFIRDTSKNLNYTFYNAKNKTGFLRNLIIRTTRTGDLMVILIVGENDIESIERLLNEVIQKFPEITSLQYVVNTKNNDTIFDLDVHLYKGDPYIKERLGDKIYQIGPKSFFQTNSYQAENLYNKVIEFGDFRQDEVVYDLYSGLGSIAIYAANSVKKMIGVEEVEEAVSFANINKTLNNSGNCHFYCGDVKEVLNTEFINRNGHPDTIIVDPPRAGLHANVTAFIKQLQPNKIIYVSCNPSTQARDLAIWDDEYKCTRMQPVDMFPHTSHVENIALLIRKSQ
ncbi:23S rRNA (uracil(1939)-C(5))-methyltransferase RlmD [Membranihabitans maritimus]|uniref:23S rRNA (uracil(1939)-C(5))-methyltransferase RlmD n=1 Tax=Membranihabitans maritimus TaxID=2904244 RepID=UPI001F00356A|nr:23S rRNA (uracil(1939)-C(5))-methyltransferase RlmD [Membranihabitans maritimus]